MKEHSEEWRPVIGYEGLYAVSDHGNVMSMNWYGTGLLKILKPTKSSGGYLRVTLHKDKIQKTFSVHALVAEVFNGEKRKAHQEINHKNGVKTDNRPSNLEFCSTSQNVQHAYSTGLRVRKYGKKLSKNEVVGIKNQLAANMGKESIAIQYGVSLTTIHRIARGESWSEITAEALQ